MEAMSIDWQHGIGVAETTLAVVHDVLLLRAARFMATLPARN